MEKAIKRAIEGGWKPSHVGGWAKCKNKKEVLQTFQFFYPNEESIRQHKHYFQYFLDPLFWQALEKAEGWDRRSVGISYEGYEKDIEGNTDGCIEDKISVDVWQYHMHRFIDHIADGKSINSFFDELLK